jgi:vacuolar protein sorting-associated protein IST1
MSFNFLLLNIFRELDMGLYECVSSLIWVSPRLESECIELKIVSDELKNKYGKEFAEMCRSNKNEKVNERLMLKMSEQAPGDLLVEKYLVEIAKSHNVPFKPNPDIAIRDPGFFYASLERHQAVVDKKNDNDGNGSNGGSGGSGGDGGYGGNEGNGGANASVSWTI